VAVIAYFSSLLHGMYALITAQVPCFAPGCTSSPTRRARVSSTPSRGSPSSPSPGSCPPPQPQQRDEEAQQEGKLFISTLGELHMGPRAAGAAACRLLLQHPAPGPSPLHRGHMETFCHASILMMARSPLSQQDPDVGQLLHRHCDPSRNISAIFSRSAGVEEKDYSAHARGATAPAQ